MCVIFTVYIFSKSDSTQSGKCSCVYCNTVLLMVSVYQQHKHFPITILIICQSLDSFQCLNESIVADLYLVDLSPEFQLLDSRPLCKMN